MPPPPQSLTVFKLCQPRNPSINLVGGVNRRLVYLDTHLRQRPTYSGTGVGGRCTHTLSVRVLKTQKGRFGVPPFCTRVFTSTVISKLSTRVLHVVGVDLYIMDRPYQYYYSHINNLLSNFIFDETHRTEWEVVQQIPLIEGRFGRTKSGISTLKKGKFSGNVFILSFVDGYKS